MTWNRIAALVIDSVILALVAVPFMHFGTETRIQDGQELQTVKFGLGTTGTLIWLAAGWAYFILMEWLLGGTLGKLLLGIRVVRQDGEAASLLAVVVRNVLRIVDGFPYLIPYLAGFIVMGRHQGRRRLGDLAAGTAVVPKADAAYEVNLPGDPAQRQ
jgi:uncharacterized RDD family membrane protein YckC